MKKPMDSSWNGDAGRGTSSDFARLHGWPDDEADFWARASDELRSWFARPPRRGRPDHRGRGPIHHARADAHIRDHVNDDLTEDRWIDASHIRVTVEDGDVTLAGRVDTRSAKRRAADLARAVPGVTHVRNMLHIDAAPFAA